MALPVGDKAQSSKFINANTQPTRHTDFLFLTVKCSTWDFLVNPEDPVDMWL